MDKARIIELIKTHEEQIEMQKAVFFRIEGALNMLKSLLKEIEAEEPENEGVPEPMEADK